MKSLKVERLIRGESFITKEKGNSMTPLLFSNQEHKLQPVHYTQVEVGDIVFCKVRGRYYTHLVTATNEQKGVQISNNKGFVNGWTKQVFGLVIEKY